MCIYNHKSCIEIRNRLGNKKRIGVGYLVLRVNNGVFSVMLGLYELQKEGLFKNYIS